MYSFFFKMNWCVIEAAEALSFDLNVNVTVVVPSEFFTTSAHGDKRQCRSDDESPVDK